MSVFSPNTVKHGPVKIPCFQIFQVLQILTQLLKCFLKQTKIRFWAEVDFSFKFSVESHYEYFPCNQEIVVLGIFQAAAFASFQAKFKILYYSKIVYGKLGMNNIYSFKKILTVTFSSSRNWNYKTAFCLIDSILVIL